MPMTGVGVSFLHVRVFTHYLFKKASWACFGLDFYRSPIYDMFKIYIEDYSLVSQRSMAFVLEILTGFLLCTPICDFYAFLLR